MRNRLHNWNALVCDFGDERIVVRRIASGAGVLEHVNAGVDRRAHGIRIIKMRVHLDADTVCFLDHRAVIIL